MLLKANEPSPDSCKRLSVMLVCVMGFCVMYNGQLPERFLLLITVSRRYEHG
jgi:hypothetical protein